MNVQIHKVKQEIDGGRLFEILADKQVRDILIYLIQKPRAISEISKEFKIPKSTTYRIIRELETQGLVKIVGSIINERGRRSYVYISKVDSINISLTLDGLKVYIKPNNLKVDLLSLSHI